MLGGYTTLHHAAATGRGPIAPIERCERCNFGLNIFPSCYAGCLREQFQFLGEVLLKAPETRLLKATARLLLENGAATRIDAQDDKGKTALHWAARLGLEREEIRALCYLSSLSRWELISTPRITRVLLRFMRLVECSVRKVIIGFLLE